MKNSKEAGFIKKFLDVLRPMTWAERLRYIWSYYRTSILLGFVLVILAGYLLGAYLGRKEVFLGGIYANVQLTDCGTVYAEQDFFAAQAANPDRQMMDNLSVSMTRFADDEYFEMNYYYLSAVASRVGAGQVDYFLTDQIAMEIFMTQEMYLDLREFFTPEELEEWKDRLVYFMRVDESGNETAEKYPVAVRIGDLAFIAECSDTQEAYFSIAANAPHRDRAHAFWEALLAWPLETQKQGGAEGDKQP